MALPILIPIVGPIVARRGVQQGVRSLAPYVYKGLRVAAEAAVTAMQTEVRKYVTAEGVAPWYVPSRTPVPDWGQAHDTERLLDLYGGREKVGVEINPVAQMAPPVLMPSALAAPAVDLPPLVGLDVPAQGVKAGEDAVAIPVAPAMPAVKDMSGIRQDVYVPPDLEIALKVAPRIAHSRVGRTLTWSLAMAAQPKWDQSTRKRSSERKASNKYAARGAGLFMEQMRLYRYMKRGLDWYGQATEMMDLLDVLGQNLVTSQGRSLDWMSEWGTGLEMLYEGRLHFDWVGFSIDLAIEQTNDRLVGMTDLSSSASRLQYGYGRGVGLNFAERERNALLQSSTSDLWQPLRAAVDERRAWWLSGQ